MTILGVYLGAAFTQVNLTLTNTILQLDPSKLRFGTDTDQY
jgi:hypothetical protein